MSLADEIGRARDRARAALVAAHDYYYDTRQMWERVEVDIKYGRPLAYTNPATGTATTQAELANRIPLYARRLIAEATFQQFLTIFEAFFTDFLRAWLRAQPHFLLPTEPVPFPDILSAPDKPALVEEAVERKVLGLFYRKPADWFKFIEDKLHLGRPTADEVARLAEAKATRDVLIHNQGVANDVYLTKSGALARHPLGEFIDLPEPYHHGVWELLLKVVADLGNAVIAKFP